MRNRSLKYGVGIELFFLISLIGFCILLTGWTFNIKPQFWFSTPLNSYGDGQLLEFLLQNQFLNDSRLLGLDRISNIGWPGGTFLELYPQNDELFVFIISIFYNLFNLTIPVSIMALVLIKFPLASTAFYFLARLLGISRIISAISSIAFAFIPFSLIRAEGHLMLAQIWVIPLATALPLYLFLRVPINSPRLTKSYFIIALAIFSGLITGFSGSYFFIFSLVVAISFLLLEITRIYLNRTDDRALKHKITVNNEFKRSTKIFASNKLLIYIVYYFFSCFGFFISSFDSLLAERSITNLFLIRDSRVSIESVIYAGNFLSLFSDLYFFLDKTFQTNFLELANQYYSWESFGVGPYFTLLFMLFLLLLVNGRFHPELKLSISGKKLLTPLFILIFFYYQGLGGLLVAEFLNPSLRAWGRISIYIAFLSLIIIVLILNELFKNLGQFFKRGPLFLISISMILTYFLLWNILYIKDYNFHRISRQTIISTFESEKQSNDEIIQALKTKLTAGCPIVVLPVYRFPEYNPSSDRLADNDLLSISLADTDSEFKWSSGNVKWSEGEQYWAPLAIDIPPFASASLETQVGYANRYGACAIALNQGMFDSEKNEVSGDFLTSLNCPLIVNKKGASASGSWLIWDIRDSVCASNIVKLSALDSESFPKSNEKPILWRYTNISPEFFNKNVGIFSGRSDAKLDFIIEKNQFKYSKPGLKLGIINGRISESYNLQVCISSYQKESTPPTCQSFQISNDKTIKLDLVNYMDSTKYRIDIIPSKLPSEYNWSLLWTYD